MDTPEARAVLEHIFPRLSVTGYRIRSPDTADYNCIAFAGGDEKIPWDHTHEPYTYWPQRIARDGSVASLTAAYGTIGYVPCIDGSWEEGVEKIAIYGSDDNKFTHAAIQRDNGIWASKCGVLQDIEHNSLDGVLCEAYGVVKCFVARARGN